MIYACIRLLPRATCSSVIMHSCERVALSVSILQSSLFEKYKFFASIVCNEHRSIEVHKASLSTIALECVVRANSLMNAWVTSEAFESFTQRDSCRFATTQVSKFLHRDKKFTQKQLQSKVLHHSPNNLYDSRKGSQMGEHVTSLL